MYNNKLRHWMKYGDNALLVINRVMEVNFVLYETTLTINSLSK
jgi:hypothetical protein